MHKQSKNDMILRHGYRYPRTMNEAYGPYAELAIEVDAPSRWEPVIIVLLTAALAALIYIYH